MPASSRTSRTAAASVDSPESTNPLGNCQRASSPTQMSATSVCLSCFRKATPPAEICSFVRTLLIELTGIDKVNRIGAARVMHHVHREGAEAAAHESRVMYV